MHRIRRVNMLFSLYGVICVAYICEYYSIFLIFLICMYLSCILRV